MAKLYLVPTPVGNLEDITIRAIRILKEVKLILAEDTRTSAVLMQRYEITTPMLSHHKFNEHAQVERIAEEIEAGKDVALISDAGTPGISDPGFLLVRTCVEHGIETEVLPGATALIPAIVNSGLPCDRFCFEGFLPQKKGRVKRITALLEEERTIVFYESPFRVLKTLEQLAAILGAQRQACVAREISKLHETFHRGTLEDLRQYFTETPAKGEIVILVSGKNTKAEELEEESEMC